MALCGCVKNKIEIKFSATVFREIFGTKKYEMPKICPNHLPRLELSEGEWGSLGCVLTAHSIIDGKAFVSEERIEAIDEEYKSITYNIFSGALMEQYKTLKVTIQFTSSDESNFLIWTTEYEKLNENVPPPDKLRELLLQVTKILDDHYEKACVGAI